MIGRVIFLLVALGVLGLLIYMQEPQSTSGFTAPSTNNGGPGFVALGAQIVETGDDGQPLYRLQAKRIAQPTPQGLIYLTDPILNYTPPGANPWVLTALQGQLPQSAHTADLSGAVHAEGKPSGSTRVMQIFTDDLHVDMQRQLATSPDVVHVVWAGSLLHGRGLHADLKSGQLELFRHVGGSAQH